jgi:hypothetical protein
MKKILVLLLLAASGTVFAQHYHGHKHHGHGHRHHGHNGWSWVVPAVIGGVVVYGATRPDPVIVQQPVIIQPPLPAPQMQNCSPWTETLNADGTITRTRFCTQ